MKVPANMFLDITSYTVGLSILLCSKHTSLVKESLLTMILCGSKVDFVLSESHFWPKFSLPFFPFGRQRIMFDNGP